MRQHGILLIALVAFALALSCQAQHSVARMWNEEILAAIRIDRPNPPVHARNLFHLAACMYDAWAAYDDGSVGYLHHEKVTKADLLSLRCAEMVRSAHLRGARHVSWHFSSITAQDIERARAEAISFAAYRLLKSRYANSASRGLTAIALDQRMRRFGYRPENATLVGKSPAAVGNRIAASVLAWGMADGSNEAGGYADPSYANPQPHLVVLAAGLPQGGGVPADTDPNLWQPLAFETAETQNGLSSDLLQKFVGVTWIDTIPFALQRSAPALPWIDPASGPSRLGTGSNEEYKLGALDVLRAGSQLNSVQVIDISPASMGNNPLGEDSGTGYPVNPVTRKPYAPNRVKLGNFARVLAEYWADGPSSETPPGHWHVIANQVSDSPRTVKRVSGTGPLVNRLEWDVKLYFALSAATHDAACAAWSLKRYYESVRPITMIRYMAGKGQSSDPSLPSYHIEGLPLEPGVVEVITSESSAAGQRHQGVGAVGEIAVFGWPGEPSNRETQMRPVRWMRGIDWLPYQRKTFNTPAFPGYVSGHSTFSRAAAEVLAAFTGSAYFPGGMATFVAQKNRYLVFEDGPSETVTLQWATYYDAADQAGLSRRFGGIHVVEDDYHGRVIGAQAGKSAIDLARKYWDGSIMTETVAPLIESAGESAVTVKWHSRRGLYYAIEWSGDGVVWTRLSDAQQATDTVSSRTVSAPAGPEGIFSVVWQGAPF